MGDQNTVFVANQDEGLVRHLLRRTGFGAAPNDVANIIGKTRGEAADMLLAFTGKNFKPNGRYIENAHDNWVKFMIKGQYPVQEKLVLYWHQHFATSYAKVQNVKLMGEQIRLFHLMCKGDFRDFVKQMNRNAALMEFLDTVRNHKDIPNENYGRELQELFTLGVKDLNGSPNYTQEDIVQIARAFTGWDYIYNSGEAVFHDYDHDVMSDFPARGNKTIYKTQGGFGAGGKAYATPLIDTNVSPLPDTSDAVTEGPTEIDAVIDIIFKHKDSDRQVTVARRVARRLLEYFAYAIPLPASAADKAVIDQVISDSGFDTAWDIGLLVRAILVNDAFYATAAVSPFDATTKKSVKWPIDYVVSSLRLLHMKLKSKYQYVDGGDYRNVRDQLANMGQLVLEPPSVFGWDWETAWLSSATLLARYDFARDVTSARNGGSSAFRPERFFDLSLTDPDDIVGAVTDTLGVTDQLTAVERNALVDYLTDNGANPTINLNDSDVRNRKLNGLFALVLQSPAYQLH
jgi:uncharacterized protein (DUF1800 family)